MCRAVSGTASGDEGQRRCVPDAGLPAHLCAQHALGGLERRSGVRLLLVRAQTV